MESDQLLKIEQGTKTETVAFVAGANFRKWPAETLPVEYGVDYRLSGAGLAAPVTVRFAALGALPDAADGAAETLMAKGRSEEHTSELQSLMRNSYAVFCLKKQK